MSIETVSRLVMVMRMITDYWASFIIDPESDIVIVRTKLLVSWFRGFKFKGRTYGNFSEQISLFF